MRTAVADLMTPDPYAVGSGATIQEAAQLMRDADIGDVLVVRDDGSLCGIVTDRDLVVRAVAEGSDPAGTQIEDVCDHKVVSISSSDPVDTALALMRQHNIRRLPVVDNESLVGIVTLGDLSADHDVTPVVADISQAPPNN
jgi:CBS domain-containing protein